MRRKTAFERDYQDLHGRPMWAEPEVEIIRHEDVRAGRLVTRVSEPGLRLVLGSLGLFWALVFGVLALAMVGAAVAFIAGSLDPAILTP